MLAVPITADNWQNHPAIREVRAIVQKVDADLRASGSSGSSSACQDGKDILVRTAPSGVRRQVAFGSEDSFVEVTGTTDRQGRVRFVFVSAGAVNGTNVEYRFYFDASGRRLWRDVNARGPGYTFSADDFEKQFGPNFTRFRGWRC